MLNRRVSSFKTLLLWNKISQSNPLLLQPAARSHADVAKPCQSEQVGSVVLQLIGTAKPANANGTGVDQQAPSPSKAASVAPRPRPFMARAQGLSVPKTPLLQLNFFYCVTWGCELGYSVLKPPAGRGEGLGATRLQRQCRLRSWWC